MPAAELKEDTISRQELIDLLKKNRPHPGEDDSIERIKFREWSKICKLIESMLARVKKEKTGRWEAVEDDGYAGGGYWQCTSCEYRYSFGAYFEADEEFFFCPHCGAIMKGQSPDELIKQWNTRGKAAEECQSET